VGCKSQWRRRRRRRRKKKKKKKKKKKRPKHEANFNENLRFKLETTILTRSKTDHTLDMGRETDR
jgi:hypothetical protein